MLAFGVLVMGEKLKTLNSRPDLWAKRYKRNEHIVSRAIVGETLLVPIQGHLADMQRIFALNPVADYVWEKLDGDSAIVQIAEAILEDFDVSKNEADSDLVELLGELIAAELIVEV